MVISGILVMLSFNFKHKGTWNKGNVRNISNVDFSICKTEGHGIMVILGILAMLGFVSD
jgi:hypothetical protein